MDTSAGRYEIYAIGKTENKPTLKNMVGFTDSFPEALEIMSSGARENRDKNYCIYDIVTKQFFDPSYVYSRIITEAAAGIRMGLPRHGGIDKQN